MLTRRSFLTATGILALGSLLSSCADSAADLRVLLLTGSIPPQLLKAFRQQISSGASLDFKPQGQLKEVFSLLETWQGQNEEKKGLLTNLPKIPLINPRPPSVSDFVSLGDAWLKEAIQKELIEPVDMTQIPNWERLPSRWQKLVRRDGKGNLQENGLIWAAPYRWGTTLIAYRSDKLDWQPQDWSDLWDERLSDRIAIIDQPREVIGLSLKKLGKSYNTKNIAGVAQLKTELINLNKRVKYYSSEHYLQPLLTGDVWVSVGWSNEIIPLTSRNRNIKAVVPTSGTSLWSDVWVKPKGKEEQTNELSETAKKWLNFCWEPQAAKFISLFADAASPMINTLEKKELPANVNDNPLLSIDSAIFDKCEFLEPFSKQVQEQYMDLWTEVRKT
ncbi:extracellular solute-binding protein [Crocosphaera sp. Alani8]|uniref:extracellular solute-binding protein n=1 Tax=Crocosphaera sp. Alani8 TaxID=3038952 RepID=UPI00313E9A5D